jgi:glutathione S-transferase
MTAVPATILSAIVTILAVLMYFYMGLRVGQMRGKHKIEAPAMTGNPEFERAVRVHMNTLEHLVIFLPLLWIATVYFRTLAWLPAVLGVLWIVGRIMYMQGYMAAPEKRGTGFGIAALANLGLLILAIVGIAMSWSAATA